MLPRYNVFPNKWRDRHRIYIPFQKEERRKKGKTSQSSPKPSKANFLRLKNNLFGFMFCPPDPVGWWHHAHRRSYSLTESRPCGSLKLRGDSPDPQVSILWTCVGSRSPADRSNLWGPCFLFLKDNTCSQPAFIPFHFLFSLVPASIVLLV